jgi:Uma2 family endonuclease
MTVVGVPSSTAGPGRGTSPPVDVIVEVLVPKDDSSVDIPECGYITVRWSGNEHNPDLAWIRAERDILADLSLTA